MRINNLLVIAVIFVSAISAAAQSTNPSNPTPLNGSYTGKGLSSETNYYFGFTGGPGNVSVTLEISAKDYSTFARLEIGNDPSNLIAMHNMNASTTTGSSSVTKSFKLGKKQSVRIRLTLDGNLKEYRLNVSGDGIGSTDESAADTGASSGSSGGKTGSTGKLGKLTTGNASKIGALGSSGNKPTLGTHGSNGAKENLSFTCPNEIMYKMVSPGDWNVGLSGQKRYLFDEAVVAKPLMSCVYRAVDGADTAMIVKTIPAGYTCEVYNGGPKTKIFTCSAGSTAVAPPPSPSPEPSRAEASRR